MRFQPRLLLLAGVLMTAACTAPNPAGPSAAARDPNVPGATGQTVVIGSHSSMAGSDRVHPDWTNGATDAERGD